MESDISNRNLGRQRLLQLNTDYSPEHPGSQGKKGKERNTNLKTLINWEVISWGRSSFTSATFPKSPSMFRCSSCFSGNSWQNESQRGHID